MSEADLPEPLVQLVGALAAHRTILGLTAAMIGDMSGNRSEFIKALIRLSSEDIERTTFLASQNDVDAKAREYAHEEIEAVLGRLRGAPHNPN